jgi:ABC-2 type transport system permease protein
MSLVRAALRAAEMQLKIQVINPFAYLGVAIYPLIMTILALFLLAPSSQPGRIAYAILGGGLTGLWGTTYVDAGNGLNTERWMGTLEQLMGCPTPLLVIMLGKVATNVLLGVGAFGLSIGVAFIGFHRVLPPVDGGPFAVSFVLTIVAFFAVGMALAPIFPLARWSFTIANGAEALIYILCGFMFPTTGLPSWVQAISSLLPPTWTIRAMYAATGQPVGRDYGQWWLTACVLIGIYLLIAVAFFRFAQTRARVSGQLARA